MFCDVTLMNYKFLDFLLAVLTGITLFFKGSYMSYLQNIKFPKKKFQPVLKLFL